MTGPPARPHPVLLHLLIVPARRPPHEPEPPALVVHLPGMTDTTDAPGPGQPSNDTGAARSHRRAGRQDRDSRDPAPTSREVAAARVRLLALDPARLADGPDPEGAFMAATESEDPFPRWPPGRLYDVVFLQDSEGHAVCDLIAEIGAEAAVQHLAAWDHGSETRDAAVFHGHYYDQPPGRAGDHSHDSGMYVLTWNAALGHVNLLRRFDPAVQSPAFWPDRISRFDPEPPTGVGSQPPARKSISQNDGHVPDW
ncbi:hypothetical protein ACFT2C_04745 [Promicromonospora sp. NPDC057138]|uniref:hypothetical protein n=1 Tax=Promicromonospora sp. NPDC057138 TaxID=3346031 RepID=UPI003638F212